MPLVLERGNCVLHVCVFTGGCCQGHMTYGCELWPSDTDLNISMAIARGGGDVDLLLTVGCLACID